jgi:septum formation inhibitor MinC
MTDEQIKQSMAQIEQDNINLDYSKWSFEQRRANLPNDHNLWQQVRDRTLARQKSDNAEAGRKYRATLEAAKAEKQRERDAEIDLELSPTKKRLQNEWLAAHPNETVADFEKKAWHLLKENLIERRTSRILENDIHQMRQTGRYSL